MTTPRTRKNGPVRVVKAAAKAAGQTASVADAAAAEVLAAETAAADIGADLTAEVLAELPEALRAAIEASRAQVAAASAAKRQRVKRAPFAVLTAEQAAWIDRIEWRRPRAEAAKPVVAERAKRVNAGCEGAGYLLACLASVQAGGTHMADLARLWFLVGPKGQQAPSLAQVLSFIARQTGRPVNRNGAVISLG